MAAEPRRRGFWPIIGLAIALVWVGGLIILIAGESPRGAPSPAALADGMQTALNAGDAGSLAPLLAAPLDEVATGYVGRLRDARAEAITVTLTGPGTVEVRGQGDLGPFSYPAAVVEEGGRYFVSPLPPL